MKEGYKVAKAVSNTKFKTGDKVKCINNTLVEQWFSVGKTYTVAVAYSDNEHIGFIHTGFAVWHSDRFELIEKEDTVKEPKQLNPHPGDKIICNNGEEFTCCTREFLQSKKIYGDWNYKLYAYRDNPKNESTGIGWMGWSLDGKATRNKEWDIREVIPKETEPCIPLRSSWDGRFSLGVQTDPSAEAIMHLDRKTDGSLSVSPFTYTIEDIRNAWDDLGWFKEYLEVFMQSLNKVTNPEYKEYLRLKDMFENEQ